MFAALFGGQDWFVLLIGLACCLLSVPVLLGAVYFLVRFIKWALKD
jgi:hypothetical protein